MALAERVVGVAKAAFYPQLTLSGSGGFQSTNITNLISAPSAIWSLGGDLLEPVFNGGRNRANLALASDTLMTRRSPTIARRCWWRFSRSRTDCRD